MDVRNPEAASVVDQAAWRPSNNTALAAAIAPSTVASYAKGDVVSVLGQRWQRKAAGNEPVFTRSAWAKLASHNPRGIYIPDGWGEFWFPRLAAAKAGTALASVAVLADSIGVGQGSSDLRRTSMVGRLLTALQTAGGNGGSGFFSQMDTDVGWGNGAWATYYKNNTDCVATTTGGWTQSGNSNVFGPGLGFLIPPSAGGGTVSFPNVVGSSVTVFYLGESAGSGTTQFTVSIDGGAAQTVVVPNTGKLVLSTTISGLSAGGHTVLITDTSSGASGGRAWYLCGVRGTNATGVVLDNYSRSAYWSAQLNGAQTYGPGTAADWSGGYQNPADLLVVGMGVNDTWNTTSPSAYAHNIAAALASAKEWGNAKQGATDLLLYLPHIGKFDQINGSTGAAYAAGNTNRLYHEYAKELRGLAEDFGAAFVNFSQLGRHNWDYWNSLSYWGVGLNVANPGPAGTDLVHPSDAGHAYMAGVLAPAFTAT